MIKSVEVEYNNKVIGKIIQSNGKIEIESENKKNKKIIKKIIKPVTIMDGGYDKEVDVMYTKIIEVKPSDKNFLQSLREQFFEENYYIHKVKEEKDKNGNSKTK